MEVAVSSLTPAAVFISSTDAAFSSLLVLNKRMSYFTFAGPTPLTVVSSLAKVFFLCFED